MGSVVEAVHQHVRNRWKKVEFLVLFLTLQVISDGSFKVFSRVLGVVKGYEVLEDAQRALAFYGF